jgi:predicted Zn finger-like uncharacterized protein
MQIACPSCQTAFYVRETELSAQGRNVRCAVCRHVWFASPADAVPELELAGAGAEPLAAMPAEPVMPSLIRESDPIDWSDGPVDEMVSPPITPAISPEPRAAAGPRAPAKKSSVPSKAPAKQAGRSRLLTLTAVLAAIFAVAIGSRTSIVRAVPDLASLYAMVGLPVNLRGLEFHGVTTSGEMQDGITVLVIEGEVVNVTRQPVELPRLRLAILDPQQRELYSWTSMLPRSILADGERIAFRSRLASPPAEGREVLVRFLSRSDLTSVR